MPQSLRALVPNGASFFTVTLLERRRELLPCQREPFTVEAMVILPDHLHCIWTRLFTVAYDAVFITLSGQWLMTFGV